MTSFRKQVSLFNCSRQRIAKSFTQTTTFRYIWSSVALVDLWLTFVQSLTRSLSVSIVIYFSLCKVRSKCECAHTMRMDMVLVVRPYVHHILYIYGDKYTSAREETEISPPNLSEGGSLRSPILTLHKRAGKLKGLEQHNLVESILMVLLVLLVFLFKSGQLKRRSCHTVDISGLTCWTSAMATTEQWLLLASKFLRTLKYTFWGKSWPSKREMS